MIFPKPLHRAVLEGRKTQTRVPLRVDHKGVVRPCRFRPGGSYVVQRAPGGPELGRIEVRHVCRQTLGDINYQEARAEGWRTVAEFVDHWMTLHDRRWPPTEEIVAVDFTEGEMLARFADRHADGLVWVVTFRLDDAPRLLAAGATAGERYRKLPNGRRVVSPRTDDTETDHGYTTNVSRALSGSADAGEAISAELLDVYTKDAHERFAGQPGRREEALRRRARSLATRLRQATASADRRGADLAALEQVEAAIRLLEGDVRGRAA